MAARDTKQCRLSVGDEVSCFGLAVGRVHGEIVDAGTCFVSVGLFGTSKVVTCSVESAYMTDLGAMAPSNRLKTYEMWCDDNVAAMRVCASRKGAALMAESNRPFGSRWAWVPAVAF